MAGTSWREVSLLNFLHGISLKNYEEPTSQFMVNVIASQEREFNFSDSNEKDEECDDIFTNSMEESFIISNGDLRKLYMKRPPLMEMMTFAQFGISYYRLNPRQQATIDPHTGVGRETMEQIIGGDGKLPTSMRLSNGIIMKKRSSPSKHVPLLLHYKEIDDYGSRLMFQPWRHLEELVLDQSGEDKRKQQLNSLALFPKGIFPRQASDTEG